MQDTAFLSTLSLRRATATAQAVTDTKIISIHALLAESDDIVAAAEIAGHHNFYPRSPCGERRGMKAKEEKSVLISIHALLAESDPTRIGIMLASILFLSTLSLRRATKPSPTNVHICWLFLSTLSLRRATEYWVGGYGTANNFYPRSPCGERPKTFPGVAEAMAISIHALLAESDGIYGPRTCSGRLFLSTLSLRRATRSRRWRLRPPNNFYPRSPCGERPDRQRERHPHALDFYPRSPCGERPYGRINDISRLLFLSTLSLRRATSGHR